MLDVYWIPEITEEALKVLDICHSKLEIMFLLGVAYFIEDVAKEGMGPYFQVPMVGTKIDYKSKAYPGIHFLEPWHGWGGCGPSALAFVPQLEFSNALHHDFGVFTANNNSGGPPWFFKCAVEVDGFGAHKDSRGKDKYRDNLVDYKVYRLFEEHDNPLNWFNYIVRDDNKMEGLEC